MHDLKAQAVRFLTADDRTDRDRDAARLLGCCRVEMRHLDSDPLEGPRVEVLLRAHHDTISQAKASDAAGRIENAIRESTGEVSLERLQWVEELNADSPRSGEGSHARSDAHFGPKPRFDRQGHGRFDSPAQPGNHPPPPTPDSPRVD